MRTFHGTEIWKERLHTYRKVRCVANNSSNPVFDVGEIATVLPWAGSPSRHNIVRKSGGGDYTGCEQTWELVGVEEFNVEDYL